jgi:hypothetical protein
VTQSHAGRDDDAIPGATFHPDPNRAGKAPVDLYIRVHAVGGDDMLVVSRDFGSELEATEAITRALDVRRSLTLSRAFFNRESAESVVVINLANVVAVRVSATDSAATGQYL